MARHKTSEGNETQQMYLLAIYRIAEETGSAIVPIAQLSEEIGVSPVSGNQMIHKLEQAGLVDYIPYKGVRLTTRGKPIGDRLLRHRSLWKEFLVDRIRLSSQDADALACRLEHITPRKVGRELMAFLGDHRQGREAEGLHAPREAPAEALRKITELAVGQAGEVVQFDGKAAGGAFLESAGVGRGSRILVLAMASQGGMLVKAGDQWVHLAEEVAGKVLVSASVKPKESQARR